MKVVVGDLHFGTALQVGKMNWCTMLVGYI